MMYMEGGGSEELVRCVCVNESNDTLVSAEKEYMCAACEERSSDPGVGEGVGVIRKPYLS